MEEEEAVLFAVVAAAWLLANNLNHTTRIGLDMLEVILLSNPKKLQGCNSVCVYVLISKSTKQEKSMRTFSFFPTYLFSSPLLTELV